MNLTAWPSVAALAALLAALLFLLKRLAGRGGKLSRHPYQRQAALFSADERAFFHVLKEAVGGECEVFGKIRVDGIILPKKDASRDAFAAIEGRHFDFLLCGRDALAPACAVQLQGKAQAGADPLQPICENVGLPFVCFQAGAVYAVEEIRETVRKAMVKEPFYLAETAGRKEPRISNIDGMKF